MTTLLLSPPPVEPERLARVRVERKRIDFRDASEVREVKTCVNEGCLEEALSKRRICRTCDRASDAAYRRELRARRKGAVR